MFADMFFFTYQCWALRTQLLGCGGSAFKVTDGGYLRFIIQGTGLQVKNYSLRSKLFVAALVQLCTKAATINMDRREYYESGSSLDFLTGVPNIYCTVFPVQVIWYICGCETFRNGEFTNNIRFWVVNFKVSGCDRYAIKQNVLIIKYSSEIQ